MNKALTSIAAALLMLVASSASAQNKEFDVYLLIGQSNMSGRGEVLPEDRIPYEGIYILDSLDRIVPAAAPLNQFSTIRKKMSMQGYNIGNTFAEAIHAKTGRNILLVVNAKGGTAIEEWLESAQSKPFSAKNGDETAWDGKMQPQFYADAIRRTRTAMQYGELKAILWHQGEANSSEEKAAKYLEQLKGLVDCLRRDLGYVPFVAGEINSSNKEIFNPVLNEIGTLISDSYCVKATDCPMKSDNLHFSREGLMILGHRYADTVYKAIYMK